MQKFSARETEWLLELDGIELASFRQRAFAFIIDGIIVSLIFSAVLSLGTLAYISVARLLGHQVTPLSLSSDTGQVSISTGKPASANVEKGMHFKVGIPSHHAPESTDRTTRILQEAVKFVSDIVMPVLYFGILLWRGKGQTPGKRIMKIRVMSIVHAHLSFWHCVERALGYGAAALEAGFGFVQFFIHPYRRCAQDRLAETIVVTERGYQAMQQKRSHPLVPDGSA